MLTGVEPAKHGVDWNDWIPEKGPVNVPTVFSLAKAQGLSTAMFVGKDKFKHLALPGSLDNLSFPAYEQGVVAEEAARYILEYKPNLCFVHFADADGAGHEYGWESPEQRAVFAEGDHALAVLRRAIEQAGIADDSVMIITADHGGHDKTHGTVSPENMTIPWIAWGKGVKKGFQVTTPVRTFDTAATALWLLGIPRPSDWDGRPVTAAFDER